MKQDDMCKELESLHRRTGRTTRLVDMYVQKLFQVLKEGSDRYVKVIDHTGGLQTSQELVSRIKDRLEHEHRIECDVLGINKMRIKPEFITIFNK